MNAFELRSAIERVIHELAREKALENKHPEDSVDYVYTDEVFTRLQKDGIMVEKSVVTQEMKAISEVHNWDPVIGISNIMIRVQSDIIP